MKLQEMEVGKNYVVVIGDATETLQAGDHIQPTVDGCLMNREAEGWLGQGEWEDLEVEVELDQAYYQAKQQKLREELAFLDQILSNQ